MSKKSDLPKVLIVIVNYNGCRLLRDNLLYVKETGYPIFDIVVVDNGSSDGSIKFINTQYPGIKVLSLEKNYGFGQANNKAFEEFPEYDYYALVNNDIRVTRNWLQELVNTAESDPEIGAVGPKILLNKKSSEGNYLIDSAGMVLDRYDRAFDRCHGVEESKSHERSEEVEALCGATLLLKREVVETVGGFDPQMFLYYEDVDLSLRIRYHNWKLIYNGNVKVFHEHMGTAKKKSRVYRTFQSNLNRIKSIVKRKGFARGLLESFRSFFEWLGCKLSGKSLKEKVLEGVNINGC